MHKRYLSVILFAITTINLFAQPQRIINRKDTIVYHQIGYPVSHFSYNGKVGLIDEHRKVVLPAIYSRIDYPLCGYRTFAMNGKEGFLKLNGEVLIEAKYDKVGFFSDGIANVQLNNKTTYINTSDKQICGWFDEGESFYSNYASVRLKDKWGAINRSGEIAIEIKYDYVSFFTSDSLAAIKVNGIFGYINTKGRVVVAPQFSFVLAFSEGAGAVMNSDKWGYIDTAGNQIIPLTYENAFPFSGQLAVVQKNGRGGYIDHSGNVVIPIKYRRAYSFFEGLEVAEYATVKKGLFRWIKINKQGEEVKD